MRKAIAVVIVVAAGITWIGISSGDPAADPTSEASGERIVLGATSPERIVVVDVDHETTTTRRVPGGTLCHGKLAVAGGRVVVSDGFPGLVALPIDGEGATTRLGTAHEYIESAEPGRIWATRMRYGRKARITSLREVAVGGRRTFSDSHPDLPSLGIVGAFDGGLVFRKGGSLWVHDPRHPDESRRVAGEGLVAAGGSRLVSCNGSCRRLRVTAVDGRAKSATRRLPTRGGLRFVEGRGELSPDGSLLAVPVGSHNGSRLAVVDVVTGDVELVAGGLLGPQDALTWSTTGDRVFFSAPSGALLGYRPGAQRAESLSVRVRGTIVDMAAAH